MLQRIAVVTGGMGGIGTAICQALHDQGYRVVASYSREQAAADAWMAEQNQNNYHFAAAYANVKDHQSCLDMIKHIEEEIGPIDVLVNNAGITRDASCCKMQYQDWLDVIDIDLNGTFNMTRGVINGMMARRFGRIINISSINGQKGQYGQVNYAAAKAGMHGFTKALALEVAKKGITVNTISPGYIATDMIMAVPESVRDKILAEIPMGRFGEPHEVARAVLFLADEKNGYITGANLAINGGHYML